MSMVCPQCGTKYDQRLQCAACNHRLQTAELEAADQGTAPTQWQQTSWGRVVIGLVLAQGLFWGLRHLTMAMVLGIGGEEASAVWNTLAGLFILQGLLAVGLTFGGILSGAGQKHGVWFGAVLGFVSGIIVLAFLHDSELPIPVVLLYLTPLLHAGLGALMGWLGGMIWQPLPQLVTPGGALPRRPVKTPPATIPTRSYFAGPIAWGRVVIGSGIAVFGTMMAGTVLEWIEVSGGRVETYDKQNLLTGEFIALALLAGSSLAGATTQNGIKQGLATGCLTAVLLTGILLGQNKMSVDFVLLTALGAVVLGVIGGGFGSQLLPPAMRRRLPAQALDPL